MDLKWQHDIFKFHRIKLNNKSTFVYTVILKALEKLKQILYVFSASKIVQTLHLIMYQDKTLKLLIYYPDMYIYPYIIEGHIVGTNAIFIIYVYREQNLTLVKFRSLQIIQFIS